MKASKAYQSHYFPGIVDTVTILLPENFWPNVWHCHRSYQPFCQAIWAKVTLVGESAGGEATEPTAPATLARSTD